MLKRLHVQNFTVFADAEFEFSKGLNVIVGTNGTGKSHVLKLGYVVTRTAARLLNDELLFQGPHNWRNTLARRLIDIFQPEKIGGLVRNSSSNNIARIETEFGGDLGNKLDFEFDSVAEQPVVMEEQPVRVKDFPKDIEISRAIFLPPKEVLTMPWLRTLRNPRKIRLDDTYPALLEILTEAPLYAPDAKAMGALQILEEILGGSVEEESEQFYLTDANKVRMEVSLVAEGLRKFGILEKLLRNGSLTTENTLFWDEPEANLNPALLKRLALLLVILSKAGFQIILATHSLFLLKEFHILAYEQKTTVRYFGLSAQPGEATQVATADNLELLPDIVALDAEMDQTDRFQAVLDREDAQ